MERLADHYLLGGRYSLVECLASGGMGQVWLASDEVLGRRVAVKVMHPHTRDEFVFASRFREEAQHAAQLTHPNIVAVHDYGEDDGLAFLVMEYVEGPTLSQVLRATGALPPAQARPILEQAASALGVAHEAGIIHRDVKPANILITRDGLVKLMDFGIARAIDGSSLTRTGEVLGTPHYLSPEQAQGAGATPASDVYALGVIGHEMLTGSKPFDKPTPVATAIAHIHEEPPPLPVEVPGPLADAITHCLAKDPAARPESARDLAAELRALGGGDDDPTVDLEWAQDLVDRAVALRDATDAAARGPMTPVSPVSMGPLGGAAAVAAQVEARLDGSAGAASGQVDPAAQDGGPNRLIPLLVALIVVLVVLVGYLVAR